MWEDYYSVDADITYVPKSIKYTVPKEGNYIISQSSYQLFDAGVFYLQDKESRILFTDLHFSKCTNTESTGVIYIQIDNPSLQCNVVFGKICCYKCYAVAKTKDILGNVVHCLITPYIYCRHEYSFLSLVDSAPEQLDKRIACTLYTINGNLLFNSINETGSSISKHCGPYCNGPVNSDVKYYTVTNSKVIEGVFMYASTSNLSSLRCVIVNNSDLASSEGLVSANNVSIHLHECVIIQNNGGNDIFNLVVKTGFIYVNDCMLDSLRSTSAGVIIRTVSLKINDFTYFASAECRAKNPLKKFRTCNPLTRNILQVCMSTLVAQVRE